MENIEKKDKKRKKYWVDYEGSVFWLIFWALVFFPVAFYLLLMKGKFHGSERSFHLDYEGSVFWLGFWILAFFPVGVVLLIVNGISFEQN